jgi:hypothetical protein
VHLITVLFNLVGAEHGQEPRVVLDQLFDGLFAKVEGTLALRVLPPLSFLAFFFIHGVGPEQVAEEPFERDFDESV